MENESASLRRLDNMASRTVVGSRLGKRVASSLAAKKRTACVKSSYRAAFAAS